MTVDDPRHESERGYKAHLRANDPPCEECLAAHNTYNRHSKERRQANRPKPVTVARPSTRRDQAA